MEDFKIFLVTKNEKNLIEDFMNYYGKHFGYNNLYIIDDNSDDETVLNIYNIYCKKGVNIFYEKCGYSGENQGMLFTKYMKQEKNNCKWLIGLDNDEFIVIKNGDSYHCDDLKENLLNILNNNTEDSFIINYCNVYCPDNIIYSEKPIKEQEMFVHHGSFPKVFYRSSTFLKTNNGNHNGITINNTKKHINNIYYLHYHNTGVKRSIEKAKTICEGYKYINKLDNDKDAIVKLEKTHKCYGIHRVSEYNYFLKKKYVIDTFIKFIKRLPQKNELLCHMERFITIHKLNFDSFDFEFDNCEERKNNNDKVFYSEYKMDDIYYNDSIFEIKNIPDNLIKISCVKNFLY